MTKDVLIKNGYLHIIDENSILPILSNESINLSEETKEYISKHIDKAINSDNKKKCKFNDNSKILKFIQDNSTSLQELSVLITKEIFNLMQSGMEIEYADFLFLEIEIENENIFVMLKLNHKDTFSHTTILDQNNIKNNIIRYKTTLPSIASNIEEAFFINYTSLQTEVIEKKVKMSEGNEKLFYLSNLILECSDNLTKKQKSFVLKHIIDTAKASCVKNPEDDAEINNIVNEFIKTKDEFVVSEIVEEVANGSEEIKQNMYENLVNNNISVNQSLEITNKTKKILENKIIKTKTGIEMKIPYELYNNPSCLEFINNSDGTTSILIKNIYY